MDYYLSFQARQSTSYDPDIWHSSFGYQNQPLYELYPNTYAVWESVAVNTPSSGLKSTGHTLSALIKMALAAGAYYAGQQGAAGELLASAIKDDLSAAISYAQPTELAWHPYYYEPKNKGLASSFVPSSESWDEKPEGSGYWFEKRLFKQYYSETATVTSLPPGTRVVVIRGKDEFLNPSGNPTKVKAIAYPPRYSVDEGQVINSMCAYPSYIVQPDGSLLYAERSGTYWPTAGGK